MFVGPNGKTTRETVMKRLILGGAAVAVAIALLIFGVGGFAPAPVALAIVAGSENKDLEPLILEWAADKG